MEHVFGIRPDAANKTVVFEPHLPTGWKEISVENLPIGANVISFARTRSGQSVIYDIEAKEDGWSFILKLHVASGMRYFLNDVLVSPSSSGIRMQGRQNRVRIAPAR
jgi:hypothetical protein